MAEEKKTVTIRDEEIKLGQVLKLANLVENGGEAKERIQAGECKVNGETETRRGRKIVPGDVILFQGTELLIQGK